MMPEATVNTPLDSQLDMIADVTMVRDVIAGTKRLRAKHTVYLPQEPQEEKDAYEIRVQRSVLFNVTEKAVEDLSGKPFSEPAKIEEASERFEEWCLDIDRRGNNSHVFAESCFDEMLEAGKVHILVDAPPTLGGQSLADAQEAGWRPYCVLLKAENVIFWRYEVVGGKEVLLEVRLRETSTEPDGWGEATVERVRVLYAAKEGEETGTWVLYEKDPEEKNEDDAWKEIDKGSLGTKHLTIATAYADRTGFFTAKPPLLDLVYLNIAHFQSASDQRNILHVGRVPILFGSGFHDAETRSIIVGAQRAILEDSPDADLRFVEIHGTAINAGKDDLADLERRMAILSLEPMMRQTGSPTATAKAIDAAEAHSKLQSWTLRFRDAFNQALGFMAELGSEEPNATLAITTDFGLPFNDQTIAALDKARDRRDISAYWHTLELKRLDILSEDFDFDKDQERIETETPPLASLEPGGPDEGVDSEEGDLTAVVG
jgi:hypothetical protein